MTKSLRLSFHLLIWTIFYLLMLAIVDSLLETVGMGNLLNMKLISEIAFMLLLSLVLPFYIFYFLWQAGLSKNKRFIFKIIGLLTVVVLPFFYMTLGDEPLTVLLYFKLLILVMFFSMLGYLFRGFLHGLKLKAEKEQLQQQLLETELAFLKARVSPHFLFNTLNNIDSLIRINPEEASSSLIAMSDIMRYMIYDTSGRSVPLEQELHYLESLLALYGLRLKQQTLVNYTKVGISSEQQLPPMLLIPIVENAFKHHSDKYNDKGIEIHVEASDMQLTVNTSNAFNPDVKRTTSSGLGLETLRRRLDLIYGTTYSLDISNSTSIFTVILVIPFKAETDQYSVKKNTLYKQL